MIKAFASRSISVDPRMLGELTISMLEGAQGIQRKEFDKLLDWLRRRAAARRHQPAELAADRAGARRSQRRCGVPICCTLQGEDLFLDGLTEP